MSLNFSCLENSWVHQLAWAFLVIRKTSDISTAHSGTKSTPHICSVIKSFYVSSSFICWPRKIFKFCSSGRALLQGAAPCVQLLNHVDLHDPAASTTATAPNSRPPTNTTARFSPQCRPTPRATSCSHHSLFTAFITPSTIFFLTTACNTVTIVFTAVLVHIFFIHSITETDQAQRQA